MNDTKSWWEFWTHFGMGWEEVVGSQVVLHTVDTGSHYKRCMAGHMAAAGIHRILRLPYLGMDTRHILHPYLEVGEVHYWWVEDSHHNPDRSYSHTANIV